jgi:two-component system KDP operon response regulator KdpE
VNARTGLRILLVEDEPINRQLARAVLDYTKNPSLQDVQIIEAINLTEARDLAAQAPFDVILLDVQLPDGNGLQLATELTTHPDHGTRPAIIAMTAGALPDQLTAALAAGCDAVLTKPYTPIELETALTDLPLVAASSTRRSSETSKH